MPDLLITIVSGLEFREKYSHVQWDGSTYLNVGF